MVAITIRQGIISLIRWLMHTRSAQILFSWGLVNAAFALPVKPLRQTTNWMVYHHPDPSYPVHLVLVPRKQIRDWMSMAASEEHSEMMREFIQLSQALIREYGLTDNGYRLILNGGEYQTFPHLHVHLVSGDAFSNKE